ncbi:MAG: DUF2281 domain-containing protein [Acidobacteriota bacterium]|nr:DUF2281 domain-containing protein [Acidobacteriota bacterium]
MSLAVQTIQEKVQQLSPQNQAEVIDFVDFLLSKEKTKVRKKMTLDWAGGLKDLRDQYTSIELQNQANFLREEHETVA